MKYSQNKLGIVGTLPITPMLPIAAQVKLSMGLPLHLRLMGDGYVTGTLMTSLPIGKAKQIKAALEAAPVEQSYSGSPTQYRQLTVKQLSDTSFALYAGDVELCKGVIDPAYQIMSSDEPPDMQAEAEDDAVDGEGGSDPEEDGTVN